MLFNSYEFIFIFLPITLLVYFLLAKYKFTKLATASLVFASLAFYSYWDIRNLPLLLISIIFNHIIGSLIEKTRNKRLFFLGIVINLSLLGYYKYVGFFMQSVNDIFGASLIIPEIILPLGVSFFTFTQIAYLVDAYRGETQRYSFLTYSLFVTVFPHLIAGPILYHKDMIPQFSKLKNFVFSNRNAAMGLALFSVGLFKKVIIADRLAPWVKAVFENANTVTFIEAWCGALAYTYQLYFDFSGYSEMAVGLGLMFNLQLPINFNSPYKATSIIDFWRRWHITLSAFLRNYLYISLGGNRLGEFKRLRNLLITMLLGGLWHGAGWTYIVWGGVHGIYLVINHLWRKLNIFVIPSIISWIITFICVVIAWVFFRADTVANAIEIIGTMLGSKGITLPTQLIDRLGFLSNYNFSFSKLPHLIGGKEELLSLATLTIILITVRNPQQILEHIRPNWAWAFLIVGIIFISVLNMNKVSEFLYFQF